MSARTQSAPAPAPVALGAAAVAETVAKAERVFADAAPRVTLADGRIGCVQRETRADGTSGPLMLAILRMQDGRESGQRFALADIQRVSDALAGAGLVMIEPAPIG